MLDILKTNVSKNGNALWKTDFSAGFGYCIYAYKFDLTENEYIIHKPILYNDKVYLIKKDITLTELQGLAAEICLSVKGAENVSTVAWMKVYLTAFRISYCILQLFVN